MRSSRFLTLAIILSVILSLVFTANSGFAREEVEVENYFSGSDLPPGEPTSAAVDPGGWLWVTSAVIDQKPGGGFSVLNENGRILNYDREDGLAGNDVFDVEFDLGDRCIWFATSNGLSRWDSINGQWKSFDKSNSDLEENRINEIYITADGDKLIGTHGGGLYRIPAGSTDVEKVKCPLLKITGILIDDEGKLWVSSWEGVGYREEDVWVTYNSENSTLAADRVEDIAEADEGRIIGATSKGIVIFDGISWSVMDTSNSFLPVDQITGFQTGKDGEIWAATWGGGAVRMDSSLKLVKIYSRKNVQIPDNRITSISIGPDENAYLCTARGVSKLILNPETKKERKITALSQQAYSWERSGEGDDPVQIKAGLTTGHFGDLVWSWAAFFADEGYDVIEPGIKLESDVCGNRYLVLKGSYNKIGFVQQSVTSGKVVPNKFKGPGMTFPFPDKFDPAIQGYLRHGKFIPSDDEEIEKLARSLVRDSSRGDMFLTASDVLNSKFFANMPFKYAGMSEEEKAERDKFSKNIGESFPTAAEVMEKYTGTCYSKNRLACAMLRSVGIPARLVAKNGNPVIGEAFIHNLGWVPFDTTRPIYTIGNKSSSRVSFPLNLKPEIMGVVSVSSSDDDLVRFTWDPNVEATMIRGETVVSKMLDLEKLKKARFLVISPSVKEDVQLKYRIPVSKTLWMTVRKEGGVYNLKFYEENNRFFTHVPIKVFSRTMVADVGGRLRLTFIPEKIEDLVVLRILSWEVLDG